MTEKPDISAYRESAAYIRTAMDQAGFCGKPALAVILGSGLGSFAESEQVRRKTEIPYRDIPGFPTSTVSYQKGVLSVGDVDGKTVLFFNGRFHYYEGWEMWQTAYPIAVCHLLGVETMILTNAAGGICPERVKPGDIVCVTDHIKLCAESPVRGKNLPELGERFFDMQSVYNKGLIRTAHRLAQNLGFDVGEGVYAYMAGPQFETPAEIRMLRAVGADLVGMSTVAEVIEAAHCGMRVLCLSCVSNLAAGVTGEPMTEREVLETGKAIAGRFSALMGALIREI
ncbi:MAG: purine-nucleoside phosphorylase [Clostridia bacterium]|nr:purine-nucleoside phosphorylase [Clostridia bacterium]